MMWITAFVNFGAHDLQQALHLGTGLNLYINYAQLDGPDSFQSCVLPERSFALECCPFLVLGSDMCNSPADLACDTKRGLTLAMTGVCMLYGMSRVVVVVVSASRHADTCVCLQ